jgi:hypothetical protein
MPYKQFFRWITFSEFRLVIYIAVDGAWYQGVLVLVAQGLVVVELGTLYPGLDLTIGTLFLPSGMVRL